MLHLNCCFPTVIVSVWRLLNLLTYFLSLVLNEHPIIKGLFCWLILCIWLQATICSLAVGTKPRTSTSVMSGVYWRRSRYWASSQLSPATRSLAVSLPVDFMHELDVTVCHWASLSCSSPVSVCPATSLTVFFQELKTFVYTVVQVKLHRVRSQFNFLYWHLVFISLTM